VLDTKSKKMRNTKVILIILTILLPALVLVALYPRMGSAYSKRLEEIKVANHETEVIEETAIAETQPYGLSSNFINYAMEASYYLYGQMLQEMRGAAVDFTVLDQNGWINDYYTLTSQCGYYAEHGSVSGNESLGKSNHMDNNLSVLFLEEGMAEKRMLQDHLKNDGYLGYVFLEFDEYGNILNVGLESFGEIATEGNLYSHAKESITQYENNVFYYNESCDAGNEVDPMELRPKDFKAVFLVHADSVWVYYDMVMESGYYYNPIHIFSSIGAEWLLIIAGIFVALMALILPFFKKLNTGWEKIFSMPAEIVFCIAMCAIGGFVLMYELMVYSCYPVLMEELAGYGEINIIGYKVTPDMVYYIMIGVNVVGWAIVFFLEYISVAAIRQFLCKPLYYLKNRLIGVMICRWIWKQCKRFYHYVTDINIGTGLHKSILKIVFVNFVIIGVCCCFWFVGWFGVIIYSVLLYVLLRKYGFKLQSQYESILYSTKQMAEGNLKTELPGELGIFTELGEELKKVQTGFSKAVAEEAKSQNMKTELITNVSHDLKTPLTAIITYVDLLKKEDITQEERKEYVETLDRKSQRLKVLIEDLFEVSKASSNNITMYYSDVDLVNLLKQVCLENEDKINESTLDIRWSLPEKKCVAHLDPNRTYRIMDNLLQNTLKYSMPHSRVYVDMEENETEYVICFKNISEVEMNFDASEITERFVRGDLSRNTEGSGLGLAIAQSFTELQNGKFIVEIDGDLFKVTLRFNKIIM